MERRQRSEGFLARRPPPGAENALFGTILMSKRLFYQDRLGTNIGKALKKEMGFVQSDAYIRAADDHSRAG